MAASKAVHVRDLPELTGLQGARPCLRCPKCGDTFSAHKGDYFAASPDTPLRCGQCHGRPLLRLVVERRQWEAWKPSEAARAPVHSGVRTPGGTGG